MQNRRRFIKTLIAGTAGISTLSSFNLLSNSFSEKNIKLTILHTNDMHSRIDPFPDTDGKYPGLGGMVKVANLINKIRKEEGDILLLDAGDIFQGTPYFNLFKGEVEFKLMSSMGYDASTMGNHDFDNGLDGFYNMLKHANFPFICSNYDFNKTILNEKTIPYKIIHKKGLKIGLIGLGIELNGLVDKKLYGSTLYLDPISKANEYAYVLKNQHQCDLIICLSHLGYKYDNQKISDKILASKTNNIDLIIGGHTHTFFNSAETVKNRSGKNILINQAGWAALSLGRVDFYFSKKNSQKIDFEASTYCTKNYAKI